MQFSELQLKSSPKPQHFLRINTKWFISGFGWLLDKSHRAALTKTACAANPGPPRESYSRDEDMHFEYHQEIGICDFKLDIIYTMTAYVLHLDHLMYECCLIYHKISKSVACIVLRNEHILSKYFIYPYILHEKKIYIIRGSIFWFTPFLKVNMANK